MRRYLAIAALGLASLALLVGERGGRGVDLDELARVVEREEDHVDAVELALWLKQRKANLRVIDIRSAADYEEYRIPKAENVPLGSIGSLSIKPGETVVLYSDGGTHAAQAWFILRARGYRSVYFLRGGLNEWLEEVMNPVAPVDSITRSVMEYFGGSVSKEPRAAVPVKDRVKELKKRTC